MLYFVAIINQQMLRETVEKLARIHKPVPILSHVRDENWQKQLIDESDMASSVATSLQTKLW